MTLDHTRQMLTMYRAVLAAAGVKAAADPGAGGDFLLHLCEDGLENLLVPELAEKAQRRLAFVQGALFTRGAYTWDEIQRHYTAVCAPSASPTLPHPPTEG